MVKVEKITINGKELKKTYSDEGYYIQKKGTEMEKHITPKGGEGMYILDTASWRVFRPVMDKEKCVECGMCMAYCPVNSIVWRDESYVITYDYCKGCGLCAHECPKKAIDMKPESDYAAKGGE